MTFGEISEAQKRELVEEIRSCQAAAAGRKRRDRRRAWHLAGFGLVWLVAGWIVRGWLPEELPSWAYLIQAAVSGAALYMILRNWDGALLD